MRYTEDIVMKKRQIIIIINEIFKIPLFPNNSAKINTKV